MLALSKPPYLRWTVAAVLVVGALVWDLNGKATQVAPFALVRIERGVVVETDQIAWKPVPVGLLPSSIPQGATSRVAIEAGEPITSSVLTTGYGVPDGWWTIPVDIPVTALPGSRVRAILPTGASVSGLVVAPSREDSFGIMSSGLVAVPDHSATDVALAANEGQLTILFEP